MTMNSMNHSVSDSLSLTTSFSPPVLDDDDNDDDDNDDDNVIGLMSTVADKISDV